jgi:hypothetical protein
MSFLAPVQDLLASDHFLSCAVLTHCKDDGLVPFCSFDPCDPRHRHITAGNDHLFTSFDFRQELEKTCFRLADLHLNGIT